ncbi:MAG: hypothetical protein KDC02_19520 [Flavobacteriales bacterium]|nr:hypothetical protein [Flavobacteriales bacterium]
MGFFDLFRSRKPRLPQVLQDLEADLFPNGEEDKSAGGREVERLLEGRFTFDECRMLYVRTKVRWVLQQEKDPEELMRRMGIDTQERITREERILVFLYVLTGNPIGNKEAALSVYDGFLLTLGQAGQGTDQDQMPEGIGEFGSEVTNPVPVKGILSNELYLSRLRLPNGGKITWQRRGSTGAKNIPHIIDAYAIMDEAGQPITTLYICPYNQRTSERAPKGFLMAE